MSLKKILDNAYNNPEKVPWNDPNPPEELISLIERKILKPKSKILDLGCGLGHHSIYLAKREFKVTGVDISKKAIEYAKKIANNEKQKINFKTLDILNLSKLNQKFDFIFEWGILHFINFQDREKYIKSISKMLNKNGKYLSLSFSEESPEWNGGKIRTGLTGATIYYSSMTDLEEIFSKYFKILEKKKRKTYFTNSGNTHVHNYFLMEKIKLKNI